MKNEKNKLNFAKIIIVFICIIGVIVLVRKGIEVLENISRICVVEEGSLKFKESAEGWILRDETILQGENYKNGMVQIVSEGQRIGKDKPAFRYYSSGESEILSEIDTLDAEINASLESSGITIFSTDITNLENQIEKTVESMYNTNNLEEIQDKISELDTYITKKTKIAGNLSPADSRVKTLIEQRNSLESQLSSSSEVINSPAAGMISYRIDGLEDVLGVNDFSYLNTEFLESLDTRAGATISTNSEKGKVVDNFECYIASSLNSEKASVAEVGDKVMLKLPSSEEVEAKIEYIVEEEDDKRVVVFKITSNVEELLEYRKIYVDIVWWSYKGLKISNGAILEENDISYIQRSKAGYTEKIYVKVLRQNDTYSIVENYTDEELEELGFDEKYIKNRKELNVYDEILMR